MDGFDSATWQALGLVLTLLGLGVSVVVWRRRGAASGLRAIAWSLVPLAAGLTGVLRLGGDIAGAVSRWALRLVFSPVVWLGLLVAGVSVALFVVSGFLRRRSGPRRAAVSGGPAAVEGSAKRAPAPAGDDDFADIEAILRKHGIQ